MNNTVRELKCEDKIEAELKDREDYLTGLYAMSDEDSDEAREQIN